MKRILLPLAFLLASFSLAGPATAASAEQEQAFMAAYKTAFEAQDAAALQGMLLADGAHPMALEFYQMMMTAEFGATVTSIELVDLTSEDMAKVDEVQPAPDGSNVKLAPKPYKKLVIKLATKTAEMESTSESSAFVAEKDGKLGIAVPAPAE
jgi:hypothetical protein